MCYVCRRVYFQLEGWENEWGIEPPPSPTEYQASRVPCDFLVDLISEVSEHRMQGSLLSDNWPVPTTLR